MPDPPLCENCGGFMTWMDDRFVCRTCGNEAPVRPPTTPLAETPITTLYGDAPFCDTCGHITVPNGNSYKCLNCGASAEA